MKVFIFLILVLGQGCVSPKALSPCTSHWRGVIDMGSGSTKLNMAEVDTCGPRPLIKNKLEGEHSRAVALEAAKNSAGEIPDAARAETIAVLKELRQVAKTEAEKRGQSVDLAVVATHALRTAANREIFLKEIEEADFSVRALTQDEEAMAGYKAVLASPLPKGCREENILVWDVGGGSSQFTRAKQIVKLAAGAEVFRREFLKWKTKAKNCPADPQSPNPLGPHLRAAVASVAKIAPVRGLDANGLCVIGIGGVHNKAVAAQVLNNWRTVGPCSCGVQPNCLPTPDGYSRQELHCLAEKFSQLEDCAPEIKGPYAKTSASNLAMVLGFMNQLGIERIHTRPVNMGDYFLTDPHLHFKTVK